MAVASAGLPIAANGQGTPPESSGRPRRASFEACRANEGASLDQGDQRERRTGCSPALPGLLGCWWAFAVYERTVDTKSGRTGGKQPGKVPSRVCAKVERGHRPDLRQRCLQSSSPALTHHPPPLTS